MFHCVPWVSVGFHRILLECSGIFREFPPYSVSFHRILQDSSTMFHNVPGDSASFFCIPSTSIPSLLVLMGFLSFLFVDKSRVEYYGEDRHRTTTYCANTILCATMVLTPPQFSSLTLLLGCFLRSTLVCILVRRLHQH